MITSPPRDWQSTNQRRLTAALAEVKAELRAHAALVATADQNGVHPPDPVPAPVDGGRGVTGPAADPADRPAAIDLLCSSFNLSRFERGILLMCAGIELDSAFAPLCGAAQGDPAKNYPTFSLALAALSDPHWSALTPDGPLRRWRLVEPGTGPALTVSPLRIDERVLHHLAGVPHLDDRLAAMVDPVPPAVIAELAPSHAAVANGIVAAWSARRSAAGLATVQLCAADPADARPIAAAAAAELGLRAVAISAELIPAAAPELDALIRLWEREAALGGSVLVLECDADPAPAEDVRSRSVARLIERLDGPVIVSTREPRRTGGRPTVRFDVARPTAAEQRAAWHAALPGSADPVRVDAIPLQFGMSLPAIRSVAAEVTALPGPDPAAAAWQSCRARCRTKLDGLARRIEPAAGWDDLVLPVPQMHLLRQVAVHVRRRATVYDVWGFAGKSSRGLGIAALFAGPSGTGKTTAAEVLAAELKLDLYRIDLATMVSKYIGETEKNLRKVFDAAEESGAILLFDEADALFGKRSEVKDSHDRYANVEVSYLLQRVEAYRGLAILTTNLKTAIDPAFVRRLRFVVQFPLPDATHRAEIWRRVFPKQTPVENLDPAKLARLSVAGGNIRNIALAAAFMAAESGGPVRMNHLRDAARAEHVKLEKPLNEAEIGDWT